MIFRKDNSEAPSKKRILFLVIMALFLITGALLFNAPKGTQTIEVSFPSGTKLKTEVADTPEKLLFGLAFQDFLPENEGMLYIFDKSGPHQVWTKGFQFPVDVIWVDESRHIVHFIESALPCSEDPCPWFGPPPENARYVIETNVGFIRREGLMTGQELIFTLKL